MAGAGDLPARVSRRQRHIVWHGHCHVRHQSDPERNGGKAVATCLQGRESASLRTGPDRDQPRGSAPNTAVARLQGWARLRVRRARPTAKAGRAHARRGMLGRRYHVVRTRDGARPFARLDGAATVAGAAWLLARCICLLRGQRSTPRAAAAPGGMPERVDRRLCPDVALCPGDQGSDHPAKRVSPGPEGV